MVLIIKEPGLEPRFYIVSTWLISLKPQLSPLQPESNLAQVKLSIYKSIYK